MFFFDYSTPENFIVRAGGWNCQHRLYPVPEYLVPEEVRNKLKNNAIFAEKSETDNDLTNREKHINEARAKYDTYDDNVWKKAYFDDETGGYNVYHQWHNFAKKGGGGDAEITVGKILAKNNGKQVEFLPEGGTKSPDVYFDNKTWDIKFITNANETTIRNHIKDARKADNAIFFWDANDKLAVLSSAVNREVGRLAKGQISRLPDIYYIDENGLLVSLWKN